jgi:hypothetical protein
MPSSSLLNMVSNASFRRVKSITSSVLIALRPPCLEKTSRSRDVFAGKERVSEMMWTWNARGDESGHRHGREVRTDLSIYEFSQRADELGSCVEVRGQAFFVDVLADCVPQGGFESLC